MNDRKFMDLAKRTGARSGCIRGESNVGAVAVRDGKVLVEGWNGVSGRVKSCTERGYCIRKKMEIPSGTRREIAYCICAEQRLICNAARDGIALEGAVVYVSHKPCAICVRLMISAGIKRCIYEIQYNQPFTDEIVKETGFDLVQIKN